MWCAACGLEVGDARSPCEHCGGEVRLDGRYVLLDVLGEGSVGVTYLAREGEHGGLVAIKELSMRRLNSFKKQELFEREAQILKQLTHHGVPGYIEDFIWGMGKHQAFYIVEEYVRGETLREEMSHERFGEGEVLTWLKSALQVLNYLHTRVPMVVHRDVKPENLMRRQADGQVVLVDFGVVRDGVGEGTLVGTPGYMAPEQLMGESYPESDVFAMGVVVCEMLTREDVSGLMHGKWRGALDVAGVSSGMKTLLEGMLAHEHGQRWDSRAVLQGVETLRSGGVLVAPERDVALALVPQPHKGGMVLSRKESLFGMWSAIGAVCVMGLPCVTLTFGFLNALSVMAVVCLVMILLVPFMSSGDEEVG